MALDNANFIAELSITDPPGSDPLSQGDEQIRTIKRATFNSLPLLAAAVNITDVQMNLMAIKNEANVFTADQQINDNDMILNAVADGGASYRYQRAGLDRWTTTMGLDVNNNDWSLTRFSVLGAFVDNPMTCDGLTGVVDFLQVPTVRGDPLWLVGEIKMVIQGQALPSNNWFVTNGLNGTVDLRDRILASQGVFTGTQVPFLGASTDAGSAGATVLTEAQLPAHNHFLLGGSASGTTDVQVGFASTSTVVGANRNNSLPFHLDENTTGDKWIRNTGSDASHTHSLAALNVDIDGPEDAFQVMPFSYFMQTVQYVP